MSLVNVKDALIMSLVRMYAMAINFYLGLLKGEACHMSGGVHQHIFEKSNMFNSFLSLQNLFSTTGGYVFDSGG